MDKAPALRVLVWPAFKATGENPYQALLYHPMSRLGAEVQEFSSRRLKRDQPAPHIWHLHWPERLLKFHNPIKVLHRLIRFHRRLTIARARGTKIVWTVHDLAHIGARHMLLGPLFWHIFLRRIDGCIHLSAAGREAACQRYPILASIPGYIVPHMHYRGYYPDAIDRRDARTHLGLPHDAKVALSIGQVRPYKNIPRLIDAFRGIRDPKARLLVIGKRRERTLAQRIELAAKEDERIITSFEFVPDDALQIYLRAADLTVAPYREILNSGTVLLSLSFDRPILVPNKGSLRDLPASLGRHWVRLYSGGLETETLEAELDKARRGERSPVRLESYDPTVVAEQTLAVYRSLTGAPGYSPTSNPATAHAT